MKDLTNQKYGMLTVLYQLAERRNGRVRWQCRCDCGREKDVATYDLTSGRTKSCGCQTHPIKDLTNQKFGKLTALYPIADRSNGGVKWHCRCDCGNETDVFSGKLLNGQTRSCGCIRFRPWIDLTGQRFGNLTTLYPTDERKNSYIVWHCKCDCGNEADYTSYALIHGKAISCGCSKDGEDLTGKVFGRWTVIKRSERKDKWRRRYWICHCSCGTVKEVEGQTLRNGDSRSCGCLHSESKHRDFTGEKRGGLTAIRPTGTIIGKSPVYIWRCECGNEVVLPVSAVPKLGTRKCPECAKAKKQGMMFEMIQRQQEIAIDGVVPGSLRNIEQGKLPSNNTSGVRGVYRTKYGKWAAAGRDKGKKVYLGTYDTLDEATEVREAFVQKKYGDAFRKMNDREK